MAPPTSFKSGVDFAFDFKGGPMLNFLCDLGLADYWSMTSSCLAEDTCLAPLHSNKLVLWSMTYHPFNLDRLEGCFKGEKEKACVSSHETLPGTWSFSSTVPLFCVWKDTLGASQLQASLVPLLNTSQPTPKSTSHLVDSGLLPTSSQILLQFPKLQTFGYL